MELSGVRFHLCKVELDRTTLSTQGYSEFVHHTFTLQKMLFQIIFSENIVEEIMLCTNLQVRRVATKWNAVQKDKLLVFIGVLLLAGAKKKLGCRHTTTVLRPQVKSHLQSKLWRQQV